MKKIIRDIHKLLYFSLFLHGMGVFAQSDSLPNSVISSDSLLFIKRHDFQSDNLKRNELEKLIDSTLHNFMLSSQNCGVSIGIEVKGKHYFYNYGETKRRSKNLPDSNSIYELGSVTKLFTGLLIAQMVHEKKLKLDDDIRKYLPQKYRDLQYDAQFIRVKHLASHTSGLARIPENMTSQSDYDKTEPYKNYTKELLLNYLNTVRLKTEPGIHFEYSSLGFAVLGMILEETGRTSYQNLVHEKICIPYQLTHTTLDLTPAQQAYFTTAYDQDGFQAPHWEMGIFQAAGGIRSSAKDMLNFLELNRKEPELPLTLSHQLVFNDKEMVGLAWFIKKTKQGNLLYWHNGATYGSASFCGFIKEKECSLVLLTNSPTSLDFLGIAILNYLQK